jgi:hypothetical protein
VKSWNTPGRLIQLDWMAGAVVGAVMLAFRGWLTELYGLPGSLVTGIGFANLGYACVSFVLARFSRGDRVPFLRVVAVANLLWAVACAVLALLWVGRASVFGMVQLVGEALFVGGLGVLEWRAAGRRAVPR